MKPTRRTRIPWGQQTVSLPAQPCQTSPHRRKQHTTRRHSPLKANQLTRSQSEWIHKIPNAGQMFPKRYAAIVSAKAGTGSASRVLSAAAEVCLGSNRCRLRHPRLHQTLRSNRNSSRNSNSSCLTESRWILTRRMPASIRKTSRMLRSWFFLHCVLPICSKPKRTTMHSSICKMRFVRCRPCSGIAANVPAQTALTCRLRHSASQLEF